MPVIIKFVLVIASIAVIYFVLKYSIGIRDGSLDNRKNKYLLLLAIIIVMVYVWGIALYGKMVPGSFFERNEYETMLYIHMYPDNQKTKSYKVPALIERYSEYDCWGDNECYSYKGYRIHYAVMPNGGTINFYDDDGYLELDKIIWISDDKYRDWGIELTNEPAP